MTIIQSNNNTWILKDSCPSLVSTRNMFQRVKTPFKLVLPNHQLWNVLPKIKVHTKSNIDHYYGNVYIKRIRCWQRRTSRLTSKQHPLTKVEKAWEGSSSITLATTSRLWRRYRCHSVCCCGYRNISWIEHFYHSVCRSVIATLSSPDSKLIWFVRCLICHFSYIIIQDLIIQFFKLGLVVSKLDTVQNLPQ